MTILELITDAVEDMGRNCSPADVFSVIREELPPGHTRRTVTQYMSRAARRGLIRRVSKGKSGPGGNDPGIFAPVRPDSSFPFPRVRSVFDLAAQAA